MKIKKSNIPGALLLKPEKQSDLRGTFVKTFHHDIYEKNNLETNFKETYYSRSKKNVLRGLHFQIPPGHHTKIVYCPYGKIFDIAVDLRVGSKTYGQHEIFKISSKNGHMVYLQPGIAHGFFVQSSTAVVAYKVSTKYSKNCDSGILWNSLDIKWPENNPILSERDRSLVSFNDFKSPFKVSKNE